MGIFYSVSRDRFIEYQQEFIETQHNFFKGITDLFEKNLEAIETRYELLKELNKERDAFNRERDAFNRERDALHQKQQTSTSNNATEKIINAINSIDLERFQENTKCSYENRQKPDCDEGASRFLTKAINAIHLDADIQENTVLPPSQIEIDVQEDTPQPQPQPQPFKVDLKEYTTVDKIEGDNEFKKRFAEVGYTPKEIPIFDGFKPDKVDANVKKIEAMLNRERIKYGSKLYRENNYYIQMILTAYSLYQNDVFYFENINKLFTVTYNRVTDEWKMSYLTTPI